MAGGRRRHEYFTGRILSVHLTPKQREAVYQEQAVARLMRRPITPQHALLRAEGRIARAESLSRRAARRRALRRTVRASRRANR